MSPTSTSRGEDLDCKNTATPARRAARGFASAEDRDAPRPSACPS